VGAAAPGGERNRPPPDCRGIGLAPAWARAASASRSGQRDELVDRFVDALGEHVGIGQQFGVRVDPEE
jgi:hypothetical protein